MDDKTEILHKLSAAFKQWDELLSGLDEQQTLEPLLHSEWTLKDVVAHLWSWQNASVARAEAALEDREPTYPDWWLACGPDPDEDVDRTNAYLYEACRNKPWEAVFADWKAQFQHYLELLSQVPERDLTTEGRYAWLGSNALAASALGSWDHHEEHYEALTAWLRDHGYPVE